MKNQILLLLTAIFLLGGNLMADEFAGGTGEPGSPWQITTAEHLNNVRNYLGDDHNDKHFILMNDIHLGDFIDSHPDMGDDGWLPIGLEWGEEFRGTFDGNNKMISELWINRGSDNHVSLFGIIFNGEIYDLGVEIDGSIIGDSYVGGLVGYIIGSLIVNSYATGGEIDGSGSFSSGFGGLIGTAYDSKVNNSYVTDINVVGFTEVGGLIGEAENTKINYCYASGVSVEGIGMTGGLVGNVSGDATIENSYAIGTAEAEAFIGGFVGVLSSGNGGINNCYAMVNVTRVSGGNLSVGGFAGYNSQNRITNSYSTGSVYCSQLEEFLTDKGFCGGVNGGGNFDMSNNFWDTQTSQASLTGGEPGEYATGLTTTEMKLQIPFDATGWDFENTWSIVASDGEVSYPYLTDNPQDPAPGRQDAHIITYGSDKSGTLSAEVGVTEIPTDILVAESADITFIATPDE